MDGISFRNGRPDMIKETQMYSTKTLLAAASLAVLTAAGLGTASAAPWDRHDWRVHQRMEHRAFVNRVRVAEMMHAHRYRVMSDPFFLRGHYVVRVHDRFGRPAMVQIDPYTGAFIRVL
jgi:hypothetical protein